MTLPSEHSAAVTEFTDARWREFGAALNGEDIPSWAEQGFKMLLRGQGYLHADLTAHMDDPDAHGRGGASRKKQAGVVGFVAAVVTGVNQGIRQAFG